MTSAHTFVVSLQLWSKTPVTADDPLLAETDTLKQTNNQFSTIVYLKTVKVLIFTCETGKGTLTDDSFAICLFGNTTMNTGSVQVSLAGQVGSEIIFCKVSCVLIITNEYLPGGVSPQCMRYFLRRKTKILQRRCCLGNHV